MNTRLRSLHLYGVTIFRDKNSPDIIAHTELSWFPQVLQTITSPDLSSITFNDCVRRRILVGGLKSHVEHTLNTSIDGILSSQRLFPGLKKVVVYTRVEDQKRVVSYLKEKGREMLPILWKRGLLVIV